MKYLLIVLISLVLVIISLMSHDVFRFLSNIIAGILWGLLFFIYDQSTFIYPNRGSKFIFLPMSLEIHIANNKRSISYMFIGCIFFIMLLLPGTFWGYNWGQLNNMSNSIFLASLCGIVYAGFFGVHTLLDYFLEFPILIRFTSLIIISILSLFLSVSATILSESTTPFFIMGSIARIGFSLATIFIEIKTLNKFSIILLLLLGGLVPVIILLFFLI